MSEVFLEVRESKSAREDFYQSLGFAQSGRRQGYYADPVEDAILMRLRISRERFG